MNVPLYYYFWGLKNLGENTNQTHGKLIESYQLFGGMHPSSLVLGGEGGVKTPTRILNGPSWHWHVLTILQIGKTYL